MTGTSANPKLLGPEFWTRVLAPSLSRLTHSTSLYVSLGVSTSTKCLPKLRQGQTFSKRFSWAKQRGMSYPWLTFQSADPSARFPQPCHKPNTRCKPLALLRWEQRHHQAHQESTTVSGTWRLVPLTPNAGGGLTRAVQMDVYGTKRSLPPCLGPRVPLVWCVCK